MKKDEWLHDHSHYMQIVTQNDGKKRHTEDTDGFLAQKVPKEVKAVRMFSEQMNNTLQQGGGVRFFLPPKMCIISLSEWGSDQTSGNFITTLQAKAVLRVG